jgi:GDP-L-fucose synthase
MHVDDLARACWFMLNRVAGGEVLNIGIGAELSIREFAKRVAKIVGYSGSIHFDKSKPDGSPKKLLDSSKAHSLGWRAEIDLETGLSNTYKWFVDSLHRGEIRGV